MVKKTPHSKPSGAADTVLDLIGRTPLARLHRVVPVGGAGVWAKLEAFNPGGSVKDRIALGMVETAEREGLLRPGGTIIEATSGNTGIGLAVVAAVRGYRLILTMPEAMSLERRGLLESYGAEIVLTPARDGMEGALREAEALAARTPGSHLTRQFENPANPETHRRTTAKEILEATGGKIEAFVACVGTGGTITGVGEVLKQSVPGVKVVAVEPAGSPILSGGPPGPHRIQGIGAGFVPKVLNRSILDEIIRVGDEDAFAMAKRLGREEGISAGLSAGAAAWAACRVAERLGKGRRIVTIFPDSGERYLSLEPYFG